MRQSAPWLQHRPPAGTPVRLSKVSQPMGPRLLGSRAHRDGRPAGYPPRSPFCHGRPWPEEGSSLTCSTSQAHGCPRTRGGPGDRGQATNPERVPVPPHESQLGVPRRRAPPPSGLPRGPPRTTPGGVERARRLEQGEPRARPRVRGQRALSSVLCRAPRAPIAPPRRGGTEAEGTQGVCSITPPASGGDRTETRDSGRLPLATSNPHVRGCLEALCSTQAAPTSAARLGGVFVPFTFLYR